MHMEERLYTIVAAIAGDDTDTCTLYEASRSAQLARRAELHLVHVISARPSASELSAHTDALTRAPAELQRRIDVMELQGPIEITAHFRVGQPSECILQVAAELDADLLIVGTHKRRGVERALFGSVAERVMQRAHCPVLVAMPKDHSPLAREAHAEPVCGDCIDVRQSTANKVYWCARHARAGLQVHVYVPTDSKAPAYMR
jgi:nucleotide-binding universal stress UspA family protein